MTDRTPRSAGKNPRRPDGRGQPQQRPKAQVLLDFDGTLADLEPFAGVLRTDDPNRWWSFFAHTTDAKPVPAGLALVTALGRLGWVYSVSTTRPALLIDKLADRSSDARKQLQFPLIQQWCSDNLPAQPRGIYLKTRAVAALGIKAPAAIKAHHARIARPPVILFIDDEVEHVDALTAAGIAALHLSDFDGLRDAEIGQLLSYSASLHRAKAAKGGPRAAAR